MDNKLETISNLFEGKEIRSIWNAEKEEYYFSGKWWKMGRFAFPFLKNST